MAKNLHIETLAVHGGQSPDPTTKARGVPVCNVPEYGTPNVAQAVFALLLELTIRTGHHDPVRRDGVTLQNVEFSLSGRLERVSSPPGFRRSTPPCCSAWVAS